MHPKNRAELATRVAKAAGEALAARKYVSAIDVLVGIGWLDPKLLEEWRRGRVDYLERVVHANLSRISEAMKLFRSWAAAGGLRASETDYVRWTRGHRPPLRFSKSGNPQIERSYRTHWVSPALSKTKARSTGEEAKPEPAAAGSSNGADWQRSRRQPGTRLPAATPFSDDDLATIRPNREKYPSDRVERPLPIAPDEKRHALPQPVEVRPRLRIAEGGVVELELGGLGEGLRQLLRPAEAAGILHDLAKAEDLARQPLLARPGEEGADPIAIGAAGVAESVRQEERALALPQIAVDLLAVTLQVSGEVQDVVGDLKGQPEQKSEGIEAIEIRVVADRPPAPRCASGE